MQFIATTKIYNITSMKISCFADKGFPRFCEQKNKREAIKEIILKEKLVVFGYHSQRDYRNEVLHKIT